MSNEHEMVYNSSRNQLIMPEYGRNIQKLIRYAKTIGDRNERQAFAEKIIKLMMQINPSNRSAEDNLEKLWKHFFKIAEYNIDVTPPLNQIPKPEDEVKKPDQVEYPRSEPRFRHYGSNVQKLIKKAIAMGEGPKKQGFVTVIGSYMKLAYKTWNKEHYVSDEVIKADLETLSENRLRVTDNTSLDNLSSSNKKKKKPSGGSNGSSNNHSNNSYNKNKGKGRRRK